MGSKVIEFIGAEPSSDQRMGRRSRTMARTATRMEATRCGSEKARYERPQAADPLGAGGSRAVQNPSPCEKENGDATLQRLFEIHFKSAEEADIGDGGAEQIDGHVRREEDG